ncbi:MAG: hypothetical protein PW788_09715 [Micavibrio sp.]|nr:hypothetical protein [Micavibrio sp.]
MAQKRKTDQTKLIIAAALALADDGGWNALTLKDIAKQASLPPKDVESRFADTFAVLKASLQAVEDDVQASVEEYLTDSWRDNLMEIVMQRFERAEEHRGAYESLPQLFTRHPKQVHNFAKEFFCTMDRMLRLAGLDQGKCQPAAVAAFGFLYLSLAEVWLKDKSEGLAKTMAAIDKRTQWFEQAVEFLKR